MGKRYDSLDQRVPQNAGAGALYLKNLLIEFPAATLSHFSPLKTKAGQLETCLA